MNAAKYFFSLAYAGVRALASYDLDWLSYHQPGIPPRYFEAAIRCHKAQFVSDPYEYGSWRAKHDPDWLPF